MNLYKHLPLNFAKGLVERGEVRVGTLYEYRNEEAHGEGVLDTAEGTRNTFLEVDKMTITGKNQHPFISQFISVDETSSVIIDGCVFENPEVSKDCWIYCVSNSADLHVSENLSDNYDACVEIHKPHEFMLAIGRKLMKRAHCMGWWQCQYLGRRVQYEDRTHPAVIKGTEFAHQAEVRAIYFPPNFKPSPFVIQIPELINYVRLI
ncbi:MULTISPECIES: hypothetical protein [Halomonadaceae]|uniref:hypothetical protein n=1 Tax=Halomonadaceae TaxID=28256 RepID=UPI0012F423E3|nr:MULTISPECIES: hypothetical protein [Halomonas]CAD5270089.1 conserved hypothetical protein [Halomonas sp. 156]CAD5280605.1 conserved hypothetical protein [Halomonas sp. 113]CAD5282070.1 conserved hypothetical protein [Halomonas sp. 59]CAD5288155.1 conserved hypothetical protein [Halomonas sp. I3]VXB12695.1 conserved hypothetical protein [Halomonas titanicae]